MTGAVAGIQARMGSSRLPGKSLADLAGKPMLRRVFERVAAARRLDAVVVLTSTSPADDELARYCERAGLPCRRGPEHDVLARYLDLAEALSPDRLVRVTGDCPFLSPEYVDLQLEALAETDADVAVLADEATSSVLEGQGAFSVRALLGAAESDDPRDREHVGSFWLAAHAAELRTVELRCDERFLRTDLRLAVDEPADLELARAIYADLAPEHDSLPPLALVLDWLDAHPDLARSNRRVADSADTRDARERASRAERRIVARWPPE